MKHIPTTSTAVDKIKTEARERRSDYASLGQSRDAAAKLAGYDDYHHVTECLRRSKDPSRVAAQPNLVACALHVLPSLMDAEPIYTEPLKRTHYALNESLGLDFLEQRLMGVHSQGGLDYLRAACHDYLRHLKESGFVLTNDAAKLGKELPVVHQVWASLQEPAHKELHRTLLNHAFLKVRSGFLRAARESKTNVAIATCIGLVETMDGLLACKTQDDLTAFGEFVGNRLLPREMNINMHTGAEDYDDPSTYWSRFTANVSFEMAGLISTLPVERIRASVDDMEMISLAPTTVPVDPKESEGYIESHRRRAATVFVRPSR